MFAYKPRNAVEKKIHKVEADIYKAKEKLAKLRRKMPLAPVEDYVLREAGTGKARKLSSLFGGKKELILIHNMGPSCSYCTLWADGFSGVTHHLESRAAFALENREDPKQVGRFAAGRKWKFKSFSSKGTSLKKDMGFETADGGPVPGVSVFVKKGGKIYQSSRSIFGPGDNYCSVWDLLDLLPKGSDGWGPKFRY